MKAIVLHGRSSSPKSVEWLAEPFRAFGEVIVPDFDFEVNEGVNRALQYDFDVIAGHSRGGLIALIVAAIKGKPVVAVAAPADRKRQYEYVSKFPPDTFQGRIYKELSALPKEEIEVSAFQYLEKLDNVLLIHGLQDPVVQPEQSKDLCDALRKLGKRCELYLIPKMGHSPRDENVRVVQEIIKGWLERLSQAQS
ncbi:MAG: alpha/beta hydrolase family protein [Thermoprotei archaeon]